MFTLKDLPLRDDLVGKRPYGAPQDTVSIALNVNENTHPIPEDVIEDIAGEVRTALKTANRYPDREFTELRRSLATYLGQGLTEDNLWAANGSNEVLQQILQAFGGPGRSLLSFTPTYSMYPILADGTGTKWVPVPREDNFELSAEYVVQSIQAHQPNVVVLCSPNNPTGTAMNKSIISAAYEAFDGILIVDEAYEEFSPGGSSAIDLLQGRPRLLISRTMSKAFAFAGVRLGYLAAHPVAIDALRLVRLPYHLSALTQAAGVAALRHSSTMLSMVSEIVAQRDRISTALNALGYRVYPSESNFVLFGDVPDPRTMFEKIRERGILIRDVGIPHSLRVTAGTEAETTAFIDAITELTE